jgi:predicted RNA-binding Zn-ribbon protein involved in translation (DUF1610 family)
MTKKNHIPVPKDTKAFICANCGVVARDANNICKIQGMGKKSDWCGVKGSKPPKTCHTKKYTDRWQCRNCGQTSVNSLLLCDPEKIEISD